MMEMLEEAWEQGLQVNYLPPKVHCMVFKDNSGALELARLPKIHPRTKHINQSFHHLREYVERQEVMIQTTPTDEQLADILTKPLVEASFINMSADGRECSNLYKNELMTAGRLLAVLDMRPSTTIKGAALLTAPSAYTLIWGPVSAPN